MQPLSLYVHIPFCARKCIYCDFCSFADREDTIPGYMEALERELDELSLLVAKRKWTQPLQTVYIGGGTPTAVPVTLLMRLLAGIKRRFGLTSGAEVTLETNPVYTNETDFSALAAAGVNRLSIGLQAAQDHLLRRLGRPHDVTAFLRTTEAARAAGITALSADLMIGLPGQTLADVDESLNLVLQHVDHLSFYALIIEAGTALGRQYEQGQVLDLPDEKTERRQYQLCLDRVRAAGMEHYEISNAGMPGAESRHNQVYWLAEPYYAAGLSASGYIAGLRWSRTRNLERYLQRFAAARTELQKDPTLIEKEIIDGAEARREWFMLGFRLLKGLSASEYQQVFGEAIPDEQRQILAGLTAQGLLTEDQGRWRLTTQGLDLENQVSAAFL